MSNFLGSLLDPIRPVPSSPTLKTDKSLSLSVFSVMNDDVSVKNILELSGWSLAISSGTGWMWNISVSSVDLHGASSFVFVEKRMKKYSNSAG